MNELLLLQIILGIFIWFNSLLALGMVLRVAQTDPCPIRHWLGKAIGYILIFLLAFFVWPMRLLRVHQ